MFPIRSEEQFANIQQKFTGIAMPTQTSPKGRMETVASVYTVLQSVGIFTWLRTELIHRTYVYDLMSVFN